MNKPSNTPSTAQIMSPQAAIHYLANLVPIPKPFLIAPQFQGNYPIKRTLPGFFALHSFITTIYQAGVETPDELIPPEPSRRKRGLKDTDFTNYPRLLFALGLFGELIEDNGQVLLKVESQDLANFCAQARIKQYEPFFQVMEKFGLIHLPSQPLQFRFPSDPELIIALVIFARACRPLTKKETNPPVEFLRIDLRLLQISRKKVRPVRLDSEEAIRCLEDEKEAEWIRELDSWAHSAGYLVDVQCTGVHKSEFKVIYRQPKPAHALFGFRTESGRLYMHINFNQTDRILPYIARTSPTFRELYYSRCTCANCGACKAGPLEVELDGAMRRLCWFSYLSLPQVPEDCFDAIQFLVKAQGDILKEEASS